MSSLLSSVFLGWRPLALLGWGLPWAVLVFTGQAQAQRNLTEIPDANPDLEQQSFQLAEGFEVNLFAADPLLAKPIQMNWDAQGRLWVATSETYPQIKPGEPANDKIIVLEDRNHDGQADKTTVFAEGLLIPTGVAPGDGGAYVAGSTDLLHLRDTNGDGRADQERVVLSGFGTEDTHHIVHTFRWGPDGCLHFNQSIYIHSHIETPHGVKRLGGGGIWRFQPETLKLGVLARGFVNPWGHQFNQYGTQFATDGAYGEGINYLFPGATYVSSPGARRIVKGLNPGSPKHCGLEIISGRHFPDDWQGNAITADFRGHRVCRFVLSEDGSGFASREQVELIKSNHVAFRPIDIAMGPDGALYIADWYNPIIQHGEVDFRDERRDRTHGRIWRVTCKDRPLVQQPRLVGVPTPQVLEALKSPENFTRQQARRVLQERGVEVLPDLARFVSRLDRHDPAYDLYRLEALWVYQSLRHVEPRLLTALTRSPDANIRAAATRVLSDWQHQMVQSQELLARLVSDDHPRVRLEAVTALAASTEPRAVEIAMRALDQPIDRFLDYALWNTARGLETNWIPALRQGELSFDGRVAHLVFALESVGSPAVVAPLMDLLRKGMVPPAQQAGLLSLVTALGAAGELKTVLELALDADQATATRAGLFAALAEAASRRGVKPAGDLSAVLRILDDAEQPESLRAAVASACGAWKLPGAPAVLASLATGTDTSLPLRQAALESLQQLDAAQAESICQQLIEPSGNLAPAPDDPAVQSLALTALAELKPQLAATHAARLLASGQFQEQQANQVFQAFLTNKKGPAALEAALAGIELPADMAKLGLRLARSTGRAHDGLIAALTTAGHITAGPVELSPEEMKALVQEVLATGDAARGEVVFRRKDQLCFQCHAIGGAGGRVGPDLVSLGASAQIDYLIDSLLQPNKAVKENYHSLVVSTDEGRIHTGIKVRQTDRELVLRDAEDRDVAIPLDRIDQQAPGRSLMPAGLSDNLTRAELVDLVRFLSELGKVDGSFAVNTARLVRRWETLQPTPEALFVLRRTSFHSLASSQPEFTWTPAYSRVAGDLPLADLPVHQIPGRAQPFGFVRFELDVSTAGPVRLKFNSTTGLTAWLDGAPIELSETLALDLPRGRRQWVFAIDREQRHDALHCELQDVAGSPAQVQMVTGK